MGREAPSLSPTPFRLPVPAFTASQAIRARLSKHLKEYEMETCIPQASR